MIIVEGPDGSGKDTLIAEMMRADDRLFLGPRMSSSKEGPVTSLAKAAYASLTPLPEPGAMFNRHAVISEPIYGPIVRGCNRLQAERHADEWSTTAAHPDWVVYDNLLQLLFKARPLIIICLPPLEQVRANVTQDRDMPGVTENIDLIWMQYRQLFAWLQLVSRPGVDSMLYDYTSDAGSLYGVLRRARRHVDLAEQERRLNVDFTDREAIQR